MTTKAPVGPPIRTRLPPNKETVKPTTIAVTRPLPGSTPEATAKAIAEGIATIATLMPDDKSFLKIAKEYFLRQR